MSLDQLLEAVVQSERQMHVLMTAGIVLGLWLLRIAIMRVVLARVEDDEAIYKWRKGTTYVTVTVGLVLLGRVWFGGFESAGTFLGLVSAGLAIALRDPLVNLAGWIFILWRSPFTVGDRIEISGTRGDVIDVRIFQFTLLEIGNWVGADQSTGRIVHVPNGLVFTEKLASYTRGFQFVWSELPVVVTFESDWRAAKETLQQIGDEHALELGEAAQERVREAARRFLISYRKLTPIVYTSVADHGVKLTLRYLCEPRRRRGTDGAIWEDILAAFEANGQIDFAYPTQRFFDHHLEGKPELREASEEPRREGASAGPAIDDGAASR